MAHVNRREYWIIFAALFVLTMLEVGVAYMKPLVGVVPVGIALCGMALTKAVLVGFYYMHLKHDTKILQLTVAVPMAIPALYAFVLIAEGAWRYLHW